MGRGIFEERFDRAGPLLERGVKHTEDILGEGSNARRTHLRETVKLRGEHNREVSTQWDRGLKHSENMLGQDLAHGGHFGRRFKRAEDRPEGCFNLRRPYWRDVLISWEEGVQHTENMLG